MFRCVSMLCPVVFVSCWFFPLSVGGEVPETPSSSSISKLVNDEMRTASGVKTVQRGTLVAPYFHARPERGVLQLPFVRFKTSSTQPGPPVFLLPGGPGSTYLDDLDDEDFALWLDGFLAKGDVVLLEQRGGATTSVPLDCFISAAISPDTMITPERYRLLLSTAFSNCRDQYREQGIPLEAYTVVEMAKDYHLLRQSLGYSQMNLMGGSFGSQLGFTIIRVMPQGIHRAIFYGVEGPGDTIDHPENVDGHIARVSDALRDDWQFRLLAGGFRQSLEQLLSRLENEPLRGQVATDDDQPPTDVVVGAFDLKLMLWSQDGMKGYRRKIARVGQLLAVTELGFDRYLLRAKAQLVGKLSDENGLKLNLMTFLVDCSSLPYGERKPPTLATNYAFGTEVVDSELRAVCSALDLPVLSDGYLQPLVSDVPIVLISGGLDGFTPPIYARNALESLQNGYLIDVPYGDHNGWASLEHDRAYVDSALTFLSGETEASALPSRIDLAPLSIALVPNSVVMIVVLILFSIITAIIYLVVRRKRTAGKFQQFVR